MLINPIVWSILPFVWWQWFWQNFVFNNLNCNFKYGHHFSTLDLFKTFDPLSWRFFIQDNVCISRRCGIIYYPETDLYYGRKDGKFELDYVMPIDGAIWRPIWKNNIEAFMPTDYIWVSREHKDLWCDTYFNCEDFDECKDRITYADWTY